MRLTSVYRCLISCLCSAAIAFSMAACTALTAPPAGGPLRFIGSYNIPTGTMFQGVEFGGISGIDRASDGSYWAISDERGGERGTPRFYQLGIDLDANHIGSVKIEKMVNLKGPDGRELSSTRRTVDPEGIRVAPNGNLYISSEGNFGAGANLFQPFVREFKTDGTYVRDFEIPPIFNYTDNRSRGGRANKLFEALAITPDGTVFTANEDALIEDGPVTSLQHGSVVRVLKLDGATGKPLAQYVYQLPKIPVDKVPGAAFEPDNGLPELLALSSNEFIAVERAYADGVGVTIRLVLATIAPDTTDVQALKSLVGASYKPMKQQPLLEMAVRYQGLKIDNIEGASWGPVLPNGHRTLVLVADNNFSPAQTTQFLAFEVLPQ